jgi:hypothetical protein
MSQRILIRSRIGNVVLGVVGTTFVLSAITLLAVLFISTRTAQSRPELAMEALLVACAIAGSWFAAMGARNLRH